MTFRKTSAVWQYFDLENENKVVCRLCQNKLAYNHSTRAMHNHIQHRHVDVNLQREQAAGASTANVSHTLSKPTINNKPCIGWHLKYDLVIEECD